MINIALSTYNFNNSYCYPILKNIFMPGMRVCIIPYSHTPDIYTDINAFNDIYDPCDPYSDFNIIANAYKDYGINDIRIILPNDSIELIENIVSKSDIIFFTGGDPVAMMNRLEPIRHIIDSFDGIVMGASAGAMVQVKEFIMDGEGYPYSFYKGLGMIDFDLDIIVHFEPTKEIMKMIKRVKSDRPNRLLVPLRDSECLIF